MNAGKRSEPDGGMGDWDDVGRFSHCYSPNHGADRLLFPDKLKRDTLEAGKRSEPDGDIDEW